MRTRHSDSSSWLVLVVLALFVVATAYFVGQVATGDRNDATTTAVKQDAPPSPPDGAEWYRVTD